MPAGHYQLFADLVHRSGAGRRPRSPSWTCRRFTAERLAARGRRRRRKRAARMPNFIPSSDAARRCDDGRAPARSSARPACFSSRVADDGRRKPARRPRAVHGHARPRRLRRARDLARCSRTCTLRGRRRWRRSQVIDPDAHHHAAAGAESVGACHAPRAYPGPKWPLPRVRAGETPSRLQISRPPLLHSARRFRAAAPNKPRRASART